MHRIDLEEVRRTADAQSARATPHLNEDSKKGTLARLSRAVHSALSMWRADEMNRGTHPAFVTEAMIDAFTCHVAAHIQVAVDQENYGAVVNSVVGRLVFNIFKALSMSEEEQKKWLKRIDSVDIGNA
jgi:hypothetical protein